MKLYAQRRHSPARAPVRATARAIVLPVLAIAALLGLGRLLVSLAPVTVEIESDGAAMRIKADGTSRTLTLARPIAAIRPIAPPANRREHQVDGSDSTNMLTFDLKYFGGFVSTPYYQFQALLREEWRYSTWVRLVVVDGSERVVLQDPQPADDVGLTLPSTFRLTIDLERPEIARILELIDDQGRALTLEVNRNDKYVRIGPHRTPNETDLTSWYFPREWAPPLATLLDLVFRAMALAFGLLLVAAVLARILPAVLTWQPGQRTLLVALPIGLGVLLAGTVYVTVVLFDRAPHILDAISYTFQAKTFASGMLTAPPPLVNDAFPTPFSVLYRERWFAQYPPGTAALLALGMLVQLPWLVQPLLAVGAVALIVLAARRQYGPGTALIVLVLLVTSPFLLLTAGAFLSHVPALFFVSVALYAVTQYVERPSVAWAALVAIGLALVLLTREIVIIPYGIVFAVVGLVCGGPKRGRSIVVDALVAAVILGTGLGLYLGYNAAITGDPFLLPRHLFNGSDVLGFGPGVGFYGEHTVASGLVNAEQQLVSLGFYLAGWPFGFSLAVLLLPFLLGRLTAWDLAHGAVVGLYVALYVAEFYHGIAFGPRYYFEALPALMILTARGFVVLAESVADWLAALGVHGAWWRARQATALIAIALFACNTLYFLPRQATLYANYTGLPGGGPALDETIGRDLAGRVSRLDNALVVTDQWWWYTMYFAAMNCPRFDCPTVFALGADPEAREVLHRMFEDRDWYNVVLRNGVLTIVRGAP